MATPPKNALDASPRAKVLRLEVNGRSHDVAAKPAAVLLDVLREDLNLTGTKRGCDMGTCGCCTVLIDGEPRFACLELAARAEGKAIETVESLAEGGELHPLQEAFRQCGASQCGFCTPGFLMCAKAHLAENPEPSKESICEALSGNLCRCTGYIKIFEAVETAAQEMASSPSPKGGEA